MRIRSLRVHLLCWLLAPLAGVVMINIFNSYQAATNTANMVADRTLLASATDIAEEVFITDGVLDVQVPPAAIEMFNTGHGDLVFINLQTHDGQLLTGYPDLPQPPGPVSAAHPVYYQSIYRGRDLRLVAVNHPIVGAGPASPVTVVVGQTLNSHAELVNDLLRNAINQQLILLIVSGVLVFIGFSRGLAPLMRLRDAVLDDRHDTIEPFPVTTVQTELRPLVEALNQYKGRVQMQMAAQNRFIANAAHQIKTPLTLLATQAAFAQRAKNKTDRQDALNALQKGVQQFAHMVNQLLTLSRAEPGVRRPRHEQIDLTVVAREILEDFAPVALLHDIDLGFDPGESPQIVAGDTTMLREMIVNLVDNALRYTPVGGAVMVTLSHQDEACVLVVADNGPGIPPEERTRVFERFYRVVGNGGEGSGLGLAIVREVVSTADGTVALDTPPNGSGLVVTVRLPEAPADPPARSV
ncbi:MAG TPA: sensor histidine kinase N-terminal domain-containing protein [Telmatospirillum sp.]|nr:sensor histidine kinase N-terminal domain-containing protein [Telmatospirillum sp.]